MIANRKTIIRSIINEYSKLKLIKASLKSMRSEQSMEGRAYSKYYRAHVIKTIHTLEGLLKNGQV